MSEESPNVTLHHNPKQRRRWGFFTWAGPKPKATDDYSIIEYPNAGYVVTPDGDITRPDGTQFAPGQAVTISNEHLAIARSRKKRAAERGEPRQG